MERLIDTPVTKFNPNTLEEIRKELNLHQEGLMEQTIRNFEDWIAKQNHFTRNHFDRHYLEVTLIQCKGSLERAKNTLDKLCTLKTLLPDFFSKHDVKNELVDISKFVIHGTMPKLLKTNYRLYMINVLSSDFDSKMVFEYLRFAILMSESIKFYDYTLGSTVVIDCRNVKLINFVTKINVLDLRNAMSIMIEGYGIRINAIHLLSTSKSIDLFITILKQVISPKLGNRIHVHENDASLYKYVPRDALPEEYGGPEKPLKDIYDDWVNFLSTKRNVALFKDICQPGTDEKRRLSSKYNDEILGLPGSFRTLVVD